MYNVLHFKEIQNFGEISLPNSSKINTVHKRTAFFMLVLKITSSPILIGFHV